MNRSSFIAALFCSAVLAGCGADAGSNEPAGPTIEQVEADIHAANFELAALQVASPCEPISFSSSDPIDPEGCEEMKTKVAEIEERRSELVKQRETLLAE